MTKLPLALCALALPLFSAGAVAKADVKKQEAPQAVRALSTEPAERKLVAPERLREFLPEPPEGWKAERAETQSSSGDDEIHISTARRSYYTGPGEKDPAAAITIIDSTNNADYFDADEEGGWEQESKTDDGYDKRLVLDGMKVIEHYSKEAATGSLSVFVGNRYFVQIELTNDDPSKLYDWLKRLDLAKLAALK